nr:Cytosolic Fe-S cluster assembly factor NBP35 [Ipomoea batatas]
MERTEEDTMKFLRMPLNIVRVHNQKLQVNLMHAKVAPISRFVQLLLKGPDPDLVAIVERMATVKHKILVLSGKGRGWLVSLISISVVPSIPKMLGLEGQENSPEQP